MVAEHEIPLIVGAYQMGIRDFDAEKALEAMVKMQTTPATHVAGGFAGNRDLVNDALLFYGEHTFGADESVSRPFSRATLEMRRLKESYAWEASRRARMIQEEALGLLQDLVSPEDKMSLAVFNTLSWERDGYVSVFLGGHAR